MNILISSIGMLAGICTTVSFLPQAVKIIKTKDTTGISLYMYLIFTIGVFLWLIYGFFLKEIPIIVANGITFLLALTILSLKIRYK